MTRCNTEFLESKTWTNDLVRHHLKLHMLTHDKSIGHFDEFVQHTLKSCHPPTTLPYRTISGYFNQKMLSFVLFAFPPVTIRTDDCNEWRLGHIVPQFSVSQTNASLQFKCEICPVYKQLTGKSSKSMLNSFDGVSQIISHGTSTGHTDATTFLTTKANQTGFWNRYFGKKSRTE